MPDPTRLTAPLHKDGEGSYLVFLPDEEGAFPLPHVAIYADLDGGVTIDIVVGTSAGVSLDLELAQAVMVALGATIAEATQHG